MPYSRRTGKSYTAGSDTTRGPYPPRCESCGERVVSSGKDQRAAWFETGPDGVHRSWHAACRPKVAT